ncbi:hypothetical protein BC834DRAFT_1024234 [Gloeopeniophorella convolvens]|nr:hypothetical protein BC834DRAFT_1024234 [Gloeopeniophorella convolvens]
MSASFARTLDGEPSSPLRQNRANAPSLDRHPSMEIPFPSQRAPSYFDRYPRQPSQPAAPQPRSFSAGRVPRPSEASTSTHHSDLSSNSNFANVTVSDYRARADSHLSASSRYALTDDLAPKPPPRRRSRQLAGKASREHLADLSYLRISASSSLTQIETPPQTPIEFSAPKALYDPFSDIVSAPVAGVETMDALVDGMNGYGTDDLFMGSGGISARSARAKERFHPLYLPPLPTPPPGVVLGGGLSRKRSSRSKASYRQEEEAYADNDEDDEPPIPPPRTVSLRQPHRTRPTSPSTMTVGSSISQSTLDSSPPSSPRLSHASPKNVAPSISEIIRAYAPPQQQARSRPPNKRDSMHTSSHDHQTLQEEEHESEPEPVSVTEEAELISRTSVDSIAEEVRMTLRNQTTSPVVQPPAPSSQSALSRHSIMSERSFASGSPRSESRRGTSSYNGTDTIEEAPPIEFAPRPTQSQAIAEYLRSARLTTLLRLTRSPHASIDNPLVVSLSDLGCATGYPLVVFLGLGGVRYVSGLYDEMADCLGIRLITIDRWGIGRTETPKSKNARGIPEWASAVEEILDLLRIDQCSVMAHSAGAPYALSFANKVPERVRGEILLLAPWVGGVEGAGYKWLKYVPTGILKTAQAAEWKIQAWMLGKPPTVAYQGIGYDAKAAASTPTRSRSTRRPPEKKVVPMPPPPLPLADMKPRPSLASSVFSDYDDLRDFEGRFDSRSTLGAKNSGSGGQQRTRTMSESKTRPSFTRKTSRGFLGRLKGSSNQSQPQSPPAEKPTHSSSGGRRLKALRSMGSLRGRASTMQSSKSSAPPPPQMPPPLSIDVGLGFDDPFEWSNPVSLGRGPPPPAMSPLPDRPEGYNRRADGRRSVSYSTAPRSSPPSLASSPLTSVPPSPALEEKSAITATSAYQAALGNALIAAAHAEAARGAHGDLLQILNHDQQPWGFSYAAYPHGVRVWYGDRDEKIAEHAVRWMERTMGPARCRVQVVRGADHGLMYRSSVVVEALERVRDVWEGGAS